MRIDTVPEYFWFAMTYPQNMRNIAEQIVMLLERYITWQIQSKIAKLTKKDDPSFGWANKEVELLLESIKIFKVNMEAEGVNSDSKNKIWQNNGDSTRQLSQNRWHWRIPIRRMRNVHKGYTNHVLHVKFKKLILVIKKL